MMFRRYATLSFLLALSLAPPSGASAAGTTLREYDSDFEAARRVTAGRIGDMQVAYLLGAAETLAFFLQGGGAAGRAPVFCPKGRASLSLVDLTAILDQARAAGRSKAPVQEILTEALRQRWPCP
jgi:hypothetical protein